MRLKESPLLCSGWAHGREFQKLLTKVVEAAVTCLTFCHDCDNPRSTAQRFIDRLANKPDWSVEEVERLRELIFSRLQIEGSESRPK